LFLLTGKNSNPINFRYNNLFEFQKGKWFFFVYLSLAVLTFIFKSSEATNLYSSPLLLAILILFSNLLIRLIYKRDIIISTRWDYRPSKMSILDVLLSYFAILISILFPLYSNI
jgi:hypothetical protein